MPPVVQLGAALASEAQFAMAIGPLTVAQCVASCRSRAGARIRKSIVKLLEPVGTTTSMS